MKIALYNLEPNIVNSAMMQVSQYHKELGDQAELYSPILHHTYEKIYTFSIFTFTPKTYVSKDMIIGGTGFDPKIRLPIEIENCSYDWSLYPNCDYSLIWFSRGCIRNCSFCSVREKEGYIHSVEPKNLNPNSKYIKVMDNNFFANPTWREAINQLLEWKQPVDFQGVDVRLLDEEQCDALNSLKQYKYIHIAWDFPKEDLRSHLDDAIKFIKPYRFISYVLVGYNSSLKEDLYRIDELWKRKIHPFVMVYNNSKENSVLRHLARWCNKRQLFKSCTFEEYLRSYNIELKEIIT